MTKASIQGVDPALCEVERIIGYRFNHHNLLTCSLWQLSTDVLDPESNIPRPEVLAGMGQIALDAYGWQLIWFKQYLMGRFDLESLSSIVVGRNAWDQHANLEMVAKESGLLPYLERREGWISTRVQAVIGAVFLDAELAVEQVKRVLRALEIIDENGLYVDPGEKDGSNSDCSKSDWEHVNQTD